MTHGKARRPRSRYDVSGNTEAQYVDAAGTVLVNRKGIRTLRALYLLEEDALAAAYETLLRDVRMDTPMTCELIRHAHTLIFGDLYDWAGRWRTVVIGKGKTVWPPPAYLDSGMISFEKDVLNRYPATVLRSDDLFCEALAHIQGEFLSIHPFREGNARTIKLVTDLLASQCGRPLLRYDMSKDGVKAYTAAAIAALQKQDYAPIGAIIRKALLDATKSS